eukprot:3920049-Rhodomonas_salina.2
MPPEYPIYPAGGEEFLWNLNGPGVSDSEAQDLCHGEAPRCHWHRSLRLTGSQVAQAHWHSESESLAVTVPVTECQCPCVPQAVSLTVTLAAARRVPGPGSVRVTATVPASVTLPPGQPECHC